MARKNYEVDEVLNTLRNKNDVKINRTTKEIFVLTTDSKERKNDLGNGSWGRIDFLTNYKRFRVVRVSDFKGIRY